MITADKHLEICLILLLINYMQMKTMKEYFHHLE